MTPELQLRPKASASATQTAPSPNVTNAPPKEPNSAQKLVNGFTNGASGGFSAKTEGLEGTAGNMAGNLVVGAAISSAKVALKFIPGVNIAVNVAMGAYAGAQRYNSVKEQLSADGNFSAEDQRNALLAGAADGLITTAMNSIIPVGGNAVSNAIKGAVLDGVSSGATQIVTNAATGQTLTDGVAETMLTSAAFSGTFQAVGSKLSKKPAPEISNRPVETPQAELSKAKQAYEQGNQWMKENFGDTDLNLVIPSEFTQKARQIVGRNPDMGIVANLDGVTNTGIKQLPGGSYRERYLVQSDGAKIAASDLKVLANGDYQLPNGKTMKPKEVNLYYLNTNGQPIHPNPGLPGGPLRERVEASQPQPIKPDNNFPLPIPKAKINVEQEVQKLGFKSLEEAKQAIARYKRDKIEAERWLAPYGTGIYRNQLLQTQAETLHQRFQSGDRIGIFAHRLDWKTFTIDDPKSRSHIAALRMVATEQGYELGDFQVFQSEGVASAEILQGKLHKMSLALYHLIERSL